MRITESTLRRIIKEELQNVLNEEKTPIQVIDDFRYVKDKNAWSHARQSFVDAAKGGTNINYSGWKPEDFQDVIDVLDNKPENKEKIKGILKRLDSLDWNKTPR